MNKKVLIGVGILTIILHCHFPNFSMKHRTSDQRIIQKPIMMTQHGWKSLFKEKVEKV